MPSTEPTTAITPAWQSESTRRTRGLAPTAASVERSRRPSAAASPVATPAAPTVITPAAAASRSSTGRCSEAGGPRSTSADTGSTGRSAVTARSICAGAGATGVSTAKPIGCAVRPARSAAVGESTSRSTGSPPRSRYPGRVVVVAFGGLEPPVDRSTRTTTRPSARYRGDRSPPRRRPAARR